MGLLRFSSEFACWGGRILRFENRIVCFPPWKGFRRKDGTREGKRSTSGVSLIVPAVCGRPMPRALGGRQGSPGPPPFFWVPRGRPFWEGTGAATTVFGVAFVEFHGADGRLVPWKRPPPLPLVKLHLSINAGRGWRCRALAAFSKRLSSGKCESPLPPHALKRGNPIGCLRELFFSVPLGKLWVPFFIPVSPGFRGFGLGQKARTTSGVFIEARRWAKSPPIRGVVRPG